MPQARQLTFSRRMSADAVRAIAERQGGVIAWSQLREAGLGEAAISRTVARGHLLRVYPRVYALGHRALGIDARLLAALFYAGPGAALSHTTAGWWWGLLTTTPTVITLSAPHHRSAVAGIRVHHPRVLERVSRRGRPVTPVARTLRDLAGCLGADDLRRAVAEADHLGFLDALAVAAAVGRGRPGSAALRRALDHHVPQLADAQSALEERFLILLDASDVRLPEVNAKLGRFKVDALWRAERVIVELDGHESHARVAAAERDRQRDLELRAGGFVVLRYTWQQVTRQPRLVLSDLRAALAARGAEVA